MLEKSPCKMLFSKLIAILLLEADLNVLHKISFNRHILLALEKHDLIPMEIVVGSKIQDAIRVVINKKLIADFSNKVKAPSDVVSSDDIKYHDIVAHHFANLAAQGKALWCSHKLNYGVGTSHSIHEYVSSDFFRSII